MMFKRILLGATLLLGIVGFANAVVLRGVNTSGQQSVVLMGFPQLSSKDAITAFAGGGQASATSLVDGINRVTVVATAADSVKLPPCRTGAPNAMNGNFPANTAGMLVYVINADSADSMNVFPQSGQSINAGAADAAYAMAAGKTAAFICSPAGTIWYSILGG